MAFTYDINTDRGKVRLLVPDRKPAGYVFEDEEIDAFLALEEGNLRRAAALALNTIASDQALVLKVIRVLDLSTDGAAVARALMARAEKLRQEANEAEMAEDGGLFDIAEQTNTVFAERDRLWKEAIRDE